VKRMAIAVLLVAASMSPSSVSAQVDEEEYEGRAVETPPPQEPERARPWAEGVSEEAQQRALRLFREGNAAFAQPDYAVAARAYRQALTHWAHPAIHGNLAVALVHLEQPVDAYAALRDALRFGAAPFTPQVHQQLQTNLRLLEGQLARLTIRCDVEGAEVVLDGTTLFTAPGSDEVVVRSGEHRVVVSREGYLTYSEGLRVVGGETREVDVELVTLDAAARYERRFASWIPWSVLGAGVVLSAIGAGLQVAAVGTMDDYERQLEAQCPFGCTPNMIPESLSELEDRALRSNRTAIGMIGAGIASTVAGALLVYLNQPRRVDVDPTGAPVSLGVGPGGARLEGTWRF